MDIGEEGGALTDTEEEAQDTNPQDVDNPQGMEKEEQQEDSIDDVTKAFGTMTTHSLLWSQKMLSPWILHFDTLCMTMRQNIVRFPQLIFLLLW